MTGKPGCPCAGIIVSSAVWTMWSGRHSRVFPVLTPTGGCSLLWWPLCACASPAGAQAATASGRSSQAVVKISKSTECEWHTFFARASEIHFYPFRPKEFFHPLKISVAFLCDYCTGDCFILFPNSDFSIVSYLIWRNQLPLLFTYYDSFSLYCQTITLFFTSYSLIHKLILR